MLDLGYIVSFTDKECIFDDSKKKNILKIGKRWGRLYLMEDDQSLKKDEYAAICVSSSKVPLTVWHNRLGHMGMSRMKLFLSQFPNLSCIKNDLKCRICPLAK